MGKIIANIPVQEMEFFVSFDVYLQSCIYKCSLVHFTIDSKDMSADGVPAVFIYNDGAIQATALVNKLSYFSKSDPGSMKFKTWSNVAISQVFNGSQFIYTIKINGAAVITEINDHVQRYFNVTVYASNPWDESMGAYIKNFLFLNGNANNIVGSIPITLRKGNIVAYIPVQEKEFFISFDVYIKSCFTFCSLVHFSIDTERDFTGGVPDINIRENGGIVVFAQNNGRLYIQEYPGSLIFNTWSKFEFSQVFSVSKYIITIKINGATVITLINPEATIFYNVAIYTSNPWNNPVDGYIKNFMFINGNAYNNKCTINPPCSWTNGICTNANGNYYCSCSTGWTLGQDKMSCVDINECTSLNPACSWSNGVCSNNNGSFVCSCNVGWMLGADNASCDDINECTSLNPACSWSNGVCSNTNGSFVCSCNVGWMLGANNASCVDVNECSSAVPPCSWSNGVCLNTQGSFICSCKYLWILGKDNASCVDKCNNTCVYKYKNETYSGPCNYGTQINTNYTECFDVSECIQNNICSWNQGVCINSIGKFKCLCNDGWALTKTNDGCTFPESSITQKSSGSFVVEYIPFNDNVLFKVVVIYVCRLSNLEDVVNLTNCYPAGEFNPNTTKQFRVGDKSSASSRNKRSLDYVNPPLQEGQPYVVFFIAFTSDGKNFTSPLSQPIVAVDPSSPCNSKACFSYKNQICNVINSTYAKCHCKNGFISFDNGLTCEDIDECSSVANTCNFKNSRCINLIGSSMCECIEGYKLSDTQNSCVDIDECETLCKAPNMICNNKPGSYVCVCTVSGSYYNATLNQCLDLDECSKSNQLCDPVRGICNNQNVFETGITYTCSCQVGFELSKDEKNSCLDIDECLTLCRGVNAFCINTIGSYKCVCAAGFSLNSSSQCQLNNSCNCPLNSNCTINDNFGCTCNPGYSMNYLSTCQANDQCKGKCMKPHQFCQNIYSNLSYTCLCRSGYEKIGDECKAIKVSACNLSLMKSISSCPSDQQCYDTNSSFECRCQTGYVKNELGYCQDVNECEESISACQSNAYCTNTNGSYYCQCNKGFIGENVSNSSTMRCYRNSAWSSWEQIGTCSMLCATDEKQGRLKFQRFCEAVQFSNCNGDYFKEELCNSELCDNKITISKSPDCEKWSNMIASVSDESLKNNETWLNKIKAWGGWKPKACGPFLDDASKLLNQDIENINKEITGLLADRNTLRKAIDCNAYIQRKISLKTQYVSIYSRVVMYTTIEAALEKLKGRINLKLNECTRGLNAMYF